MFSHIHPDNYDAQLSKKQQDMATLFSVFNLPAPDLYPSAPLNYRQRAEFRVWHDGDEQLGISQTIHTGESITIGDQTINIAELNGQSFDRQFIIDNQAEILAITDSINYDFDTGIDSLSNINIIFDGDYKVNMDLT